MKRNIRLVLTAFFFLLAIEVFTIIYVSFHKSPINPPLPLKLSDKCQNFPQDKRQQCFEQNIKSILNQRGIDAALQELADFSSQDRPSLALCHGLAHKIGEAAYLTFKDGKGFSVSPKVTYCSYGFFHGFMETAIQQSENFSRVRAFCSYINKQITSYGLDLKSECYHGIGHGLVTEYESNTAAINVSILSKQALDLCDQVAERMEQSSQCATGVFNGIGNLYTASEYGLKIKKDDPLWLCKGQPDRFKDPCYGLMARVYLPAAKNDLADAIKLAVNTAEDYYLESVVANIATIFVGTNSNQDLSNFINTCKSFSQRISDACLLGSVNGYLQFGKPDKEHVGALNFCESPLLTKTDKSNCFKETFAYLTKLYADDKLKEICKSIEIEFQNLCYFSI